MDRLSVARLNMPESIEGCEHQLKIICYAWACALDSDDDDYAELLSELKHFLWNQYKRLGGDATQIGDLVKWGRERVFEQLKQCENQIQHDY